MDKLYKIDMASKAVASLIEKQPYLMQLSIHMMLKELYTGITSYPGDSDFHQWKEDVRFLEELDEALDELKKVQND